MMSSTIAVIIEAAFRDTIRCDTNRAGETCWDAPDNYIKAVEEGLAKIKAIRDAYDEAGRVP
jgi:hypothetical protein